MTRCERSELVSVELVLLVRGVPGWCRFNNGSTLWFGIVIKINFGLMLVLIVFALFFFLSL